MAQPGFCPYWVLEVGSPTAEACAPLPGGDPGCCSHLGLGWLLSVSSSCLPLVLAKHLGLGRTLAQGGWGDSAPWLGPQPVEATDDAFWDQFWADTATSVQDVFALVPAAEIRAVREESPSNLATLCYKVT